MDAAEQRMSDPAKVFDARTQEKRVAIEGALAYRRAREYEHALALLLRAKKHVPGDAELLLDIALLEDEMHLYLDADAAATEARELSPERADILYAQARIKMDLQHAPAAEEAMAQYLKLQPQDASAHYGMGRLYRSELRNDEAAAEFTRSLTLQPRQAESNYQMGELASERGDEGQAAEFYERALAVDPTHAGALTGKAILAYHAKDYVSAESLLRSAEKSAPDFDKAHSSRALVLARLGRKQESKDELAIAVKLQAEKTKNKGLRLADHP